MELRKSCERCGWKFPGFHVCVDLSEPHSFEGQISPPVKRSESTVNRYSADRVLNAERDSKIVINYIHGHSSSAIAEKFSIPTHTVLRILHRAEAEGFLTLRPRGGGHKTFSRSNEWHL